MSTLKIAALLALIVICLGVLGIGPGLLHMLALSLVILCVGILLPG
jgi:hypothetical protein